MGDVSSVQVRGARGMLDWSMLDLARAARVSVSTVRRFEDGRLEGVSAASVAAMRGALEFEGVRFLADDGTGPGMRLIRRRPSAVASHLS